MFYSNLLLMFYTEFLHFLLLPNEGMFILLVIAFLSKKILYKSLMFGACYNLFLMI